MDENLAYTSDIEQLIRDARAEEWSDEEIVRIVTWGSTYNDVRKIAKRWAPALRLSTAEFMRIARPKPRGNA